MSRRLPWTSRSTPQLVVHNTLSRHAASLITDASKLHYTFGKKGIREIHADTSQLPELTEAVHEHAEEHTNFNAEVTEAHLPSCRAFQGDPGLGTTMCYLFNDGRP